MRAVYHALASASKQVRPPIATGSHIRSFHASSAMLARRTKMEEKITASDALELLDDEFDDDDTASSGHMMLRQHRQILHYLRLIEHEMPKLVAFRKPFVPPDSSSPLIVRSLDYAGEEHPATLKRVLVVAVDDLPLAGQHAVHKLKLLAGPRWTPNPPSDAGVSRNKDWGNGYVKISSEDFPKPAMNLKWASDALDRLVATANDTSDTFAKVPLDLRHVYAKARKAKKGEHLRGRVFHRPTIRDFPAEWLPSGRAAASPGPPTSIA